MQGIRTIAAFSAIFTVSVAPANAQSPAVRTFQPSSAWALDYGKDYCRLMRDFQSGDEVAGIFLERIQPGPTVRLILVGNSVKLFRGAPDIGYRMLPAGAPRVVQKLRFQTSDGQQYLNLGPTTLADIAPPRPGAPPAPPPPYSRTSEVAAAAQITGIALDRGLTSPMVLDTGPLGEAARALQTCTDDLLASWGLDAEKHKSLTRIAMPAQPTAGWVASDVVPFEAFAKLSGGNNEIRVMVDKTGKPGSCQIHWPTLGDAVNKKICSAVMDKGRFLPALDRMGAAIDSYWIANLFFLLPPFGSR